MLSKIVEDFTDIDFTGIGLPMWTLYDHPNDFPKAYVVRLFDGATGKPTATIMLFDTIREAWNKFGHAAFIARDDNDDPKIVGSWM